MYYLARTPHFRDAKDKPTEYWAGWEKDVTLDARDAWYARTEAAAIEYAEEIKRRTGADFTPAAAD